MYRNILIPVVFDPDGKTSAAFDAARALSEPEGRITLMHVIESIPAYAMEHIPVQTLDDTRAKLAEKLSDLAKGLPGSQTALTDGSPGTEIARWAEENGADCIVIASHQPRFSDILLGSVAHHVVRHAKCAVHVVR